MTTELIRIAEDTKSNESRSRSNTKRVDELTFGLKKVENIANDLDHTINKNGLKKAINDMRDEFQLLRESVEKKFESVETKIDEIKQGFQDFYLHRSDTCPVARQQKELGGLNKEQQDVLDKKREKKIRLIEIIVIILALIPVYIGLWLI